MYRYSAETREKVDKYIVELWEYDLTGEQIADRLNREGYVRPDGSLFRDKDVYNRVAKIRERSAAKRQLELPIQPPPPTPSPIASVTKIVQDATLSPEKKIEDLGKLLGVAPTEVRITEYQGRRTFGIYPRGGKYSIIMFQGLKAKAILDHIDELEHFVTEEHG